MDIKKMETLLKRYREKDREVKAAIMRHDAKATFRHIRERRKIDKEIEDERKNGMRYAVVRSTVFTTREEKKK